MSLIPSKISNWAIFSKVSERALEPNYIYWKYTTSVEYFRTANKMDTNWGSEVDSKQPK